MTNIKEILATLPTHFKEACISSTRHRLMTISSIITMSIMLVLLGGANLLRINIDSMSKSISEEISIHVKLNAEIVETEDLVSIEKNIKKIKGISKIELSTKDEEFDKLVEAYGDDSEIFMRFKETNPLGNAYIVTPMDPETIDLIADQIAEIEGVNNVAYGGTATANLISVLKGINYIVYGVFIVLFIVVIALISTAINLAITSRKNEINIMQLIGATKSYIRTPFLIEGGLIGIISSILPCIIIWIGYNNLYQSIYEVLASTMLTVAPPVSTLPQTVILMIITALSIGIFGSLRAVNKNLKYE